MTASRRFCALLAGCLMAFAGAARAGPVTTGDSELGRLFLTPETRATLERQRRTEQPAAPPVAGAPLRLDGVVVRSSGASTVWINRRPQAGNPGEKGIAVSASPRQPGKVRVSSGETPAVDLKVGATLNPATGGQRGVLQDGEIRVRPARQP